MSKKIRCKKEKQLIPLILNLIHNFSWFNISKFLCRKYVLPFITHSCLKGLEYMNECGFAHLDIKAGNIGYDDYGRIKLVSDFSFSIGNELNYVIFKLK